MLKEIFITPTALEDLQEGINYYNAQLRKLGIKFEAFLGKESMLFIIPKY